VLSRPIANQLEKRTALRDRETDVVMR